MVGSILQNLKILEWNFLSFVGLEQIFSYFFIKQIESFFSSSNLNIAMIKNALKNYYVFYKANR